MKEQLVMTKSKTNILNSALNTIRLEGQQILDLEKHLNLDFVLAVETILQSTGKVIVSGMGKSGIVGKKIAATLASTGTPSFFLHPGEAYHGDLGMIEPDDIVILISNSGETDEIIKLIPFLQKQKNVTISITSGKRSTLAKNTNFVLNIGVDKEACPLNLAPTSSTTCTLVIGDALATALMRQRGFQDTDFAKFHPGGSLGKRLLFSAQDIMKREIPSINSLDEDIKDIIHKISKYRLGLCVVVDDKQELLGIITDGDIRRIMEEKEEDFFSLKAKDIYSKNPISIAPETKVYEIQQLLLGKKINSVLVTKNNKVKGVVQIYDIQ